MSHTRRGAAPYPEELPGPVLMSAPVRRPRSIRRTSNMDVTRSQGEGFMAPYDNLSGAARDLVTGDDGHAIAAQASITVHLDGGVITSVDQSPADPAASALVGLRIGFGFRSGAKELLTAAAGTPLGLLIDDLSGAGAPSGYASIRHRVLTGGDGTVPVALPVVTPAPAGAPPMRTQLNVCAGWREHGLPMSLRENGEALPFEDDPWRAPDLASDDDLAWHDMPPLTPQQTRRMRRLDLWRDGGQLVIDAMFRDVMVDPDGTQRVVHEYAVQGTIDPTTMTVTALVADPRALPFPTDCPFAAGSTRFIVGQPVADLRLSVRGLSSGPDSCTHLNDLYRSLSDVVTMVAQLPA